MEEIGYWQSLECGALFIVHFQIRLVVISSDDDGAGRAARQDRLRFDAGIANKRLAQGPAPPIRMPFARLLTVKLAIEQIDRSFAWNTPQFAVGAIGDGSRITLAVAD